MNLKTRLGFLLFVLTCSLAPKAIAGDSVWFAKTILRSYGRIGILFDVGIYYGQTEVIANFVAGNSWQNTTAIYDIKLGYITEDSLYFGADFTSRSDNQISVTSVSGSSAGVGVGYFSDGGFNIRAYYKFSDVYGDYQDGSGFQADLGYMLNPTSNFFIGLAVSVRQSTYKTNNMIAGFNSWTRKETYPFINIGFLLN